MEPKSVKGLKEIKVKQALDTLSKSYPLLHEFSKIIDKFDEKRDLEYFYSLYDEIRPAVNTIVIYVVENKLAGINKTIDEYIFGSQKIVDHLKILHSRFKLINKCSIDEKHPNWYVASKKESEEILKDIRLILNGMSSLKEYHLSY